MVKLSYFGHSFFKLSFPEGNVLIDPFLDYTAVPENLKPVQECTVKKKDLNDIDLVLVSHEHFDHFDKAAVENIVLRNNAMVIAHQSLLDEIDVPSNFKFAAEVGKKARLRKLEVEAVPAHHRQSFYPVGFVVSDGNVSVYHAGDTDLLNRFREIKSDVALLPIGGSMTMDIVDGVRATKIIKPELVIPMHYNTFPVIKQDPHDFRKRIEKSVLKTKVAVLDPGQSIEFKK